MSEPVARAMAGSPAGTGGAIWRWPPPAWPDPTPTSGATRWDWSTWPWPRRTAPGCGKSQQGLGRERVRHVSASTPLTWPGSISLRPGGKIKTATGILPETEYPPCFFIEADNCHPSGPGGHKRPAPPVLETARLSSPFRGDSHSVKPDQYWLRLAKSGSRRAVGIPALPVITDLQIERCALPYGSWPDLPQPDRGPACLQAAVHPIHQGGICIKVPPSWTFRLILSR